MNIILLKYFDRLNQEIADFTRYILPSPAETKAREQTARLIANIVEQDSNGQFKSVMFGSNASGYGLGMADVDIRLCLPKREHQITAPNRDEMLLLEEYLQRVQGLLLQSGFRQAKFLRSRVPLVDAIHDESGIRVQIVSTNSTRLSHAYIKQQMELHPDLLSVYAVAKVLLKIRNLMDVWRGGIGSYTLINMVIASLKLLPSESLGENLVNFLDFYSKLETRKSTVGLIPPAIHEKYHSKHDFSDLPQNPTTEQLVRLYVCANSFF